MYNRFSLNFIIAANKFCSNVFIQPVQYRFKDFQLKFSVQTHKLIIRNYSDPNNPTFAVTEQYDKVNEEKLQTLLQDPKFKAKYDKLQLEIEFIRFYSNKLPSKITAFSWLQLLESATKGQRRSYLEFLWKIEMKDAHKEQKKLMKQAIRQTEGDNLNTWNKNTFLLRIRDQTMSQFYQRRLVNAMLFEPILAFDLSYDQYMAPYEQTNCAKQLLLAFSVNRMHDSPFNIYFCNTDKKSIVMQRLHQSIPQIYDDNFPLNITSKSYLEIFDKDKLVYLSPHAAENLFQFDPNTVYIVGGMVDKMNPKPFSFQKANSEGIKTKKFPLAEILEWGTGSKKNLPINQVVSILLDLKETNNWHIALRHIPKRKLQHSRQYNMEKALIKRAKLLNDPK